MGGKRSKITLIFILFLTMACTVDLFGSSPTNVAATNPAPVNTPINTPESQTVNTPEQAATTQSTSTTNDCPTSGKFTDAAVMPCWSVDTPLVVTSKAIALTQITYNKGSLDFNYQATETYAYVTFKGGPYPTGVKLSATATSLQSNTHAIVLACNMSDNGWFEARVSTSGVYSIYSYKSELKAAGVNPYTNYVDASSDAIKTGYEKTNVITLSCLGSEMILDINGKVVYDHVLKEMQPGGYVGLGAMSFDRYPVDIRFTSYTVEAK